jgi:hypothetical protein
MTAMLRHGELVRDLVELFTILACALLILAIGGTYVYAIVSLASIHSMLPWLTLGTAVLGARLVSRMFED